MPEPDKRHLVTLEINGTPRTVAVEPRKLLVHLIREDLGLTGTHIGCDTSQCGACTVDIDGRAVKSCTVLAVMADGASITTIEGLASADGEAPPAPDGIPRTPCAAMRLLHARHDHERARLLKHHPNPTEDEIRHDLAGNICRCTGYHNIVRAVASLAARVPP